MYSCTGHHLDDVKPHSVLHFGHVMRPMSATCIAVKRNPSLVF